MPDRLLRLHFSEDDRFGARGVPLYEAVVTRCRELGIAGATVLRGLEGYGETGGIHRHPIVVLVADTAENIDRLRAAIEDMVHDALIAVSDVTLLRVRKIP
jgi:uncharacterized protein